MLFEDVVFGPDDVGTAFTSNAENESDFITFETLITDGKDSALSLASRLLDGGGFGIGTNESQIHPTEGMQYHVDQFGPDLIGYDVEYVELEFLLWNLSPSSDPLFVYHDITISILIYGQLIPEPSVSFLLVCAGMLALHARWASY
ncbi:MAG: hypothetical protein AAF711_18625 [Planctomycetota bacterium]